MSRFQALDAGLISTGWAWIATNDIVAAEEATIPDSVTVGGDQGVYAAKMALSGWIYFEDEQRFEPGFVEAVRARTAADFGMTNENNISSLAMNLHDVCACRHVMSLCSGHHSCMQAVMLYARACDKLSLVQCKTNATAMMEAMRSISFIGKAGNPVRLDKDEDLIPGSVAFRNYNFRPSVCLFYEHWFVCMTNPQRTEVQWPNTQS